MGEVTVLLMGITSIALASILFFLSTRARRSAGVPAGEVFYQDLVGQPFAARDLRSVLLGISGKPDCLIRTIDGIVPVELKHPSGRRRAYCVLVEEQLKAKVPYGLVIYGGQQVRRVELTTANREWLMHTIAAVRTARLAKAAKRNHNQSGRCSGCGVRDHCDQALL
jgi:CRISPR-associated exonuclease Cas4